MSPTVHQRTIPPCSFHETSADKTRVIPIEFMSGLFSMFPDTPWISHCLGNNSRGELRSAGTVHIPRQAILHDSSCSLHFIADVDCTLEIFQLAGNLELSRDTTTWNSTSSNHKWPTPGGIDETNTRLIGVVQIKPGQIGKITGEKLSQILENLNEGKLNLIIRRSDTGMQTVNITGKLKIERLFQQALKTGCLLRTLLSSPVFTAH